MAFTNVTIPVDFQPIGGNSIIYVFNESVTAGKVNLRVELEVWDADSATIQLGGARFTFACDYSTGNFTCDISAAMRTLLKFDKLGSALPAGQKLPNHYRRLHLKVEELWNGGTSGLISLAANVAVVFNATKHIYTDPLGTFPTEYVIEDGGGGATNVFPLYPTREFPSGPTFPRAKITAWTGLRCFVDYLMSTTAAKFNRLNLFVSDAGTSGAASETYTITSWRPPRETLKYLWGVDFLLPTSLPPVGGSLVFYTDLTSVTDWGETQTNTRRTDFGFGTIYGQTFTPAATGGTHYITLYKVERVGAPTYTINFEIWSTAAGLPNALLATFNKKILHHPSGADMTIKIDGITLNAATQYALVVNPQNDGLGNVGNHIRFFSSGASFFGGGTEIQKIGAGAWTTNAGDVNGQDSLFTTSQKAITAVEIRDSLQMQNVTFLTWLGDVGGRISWAFDWSQDSGYKLETDRRAPSNRLFARGLAPLEWHMINELNKPGARYSDFKKIGQRVLDLTRVSAYQDVYVLPTADRYRTSQVQANAEINLELQELPPNQVTQ